MPQVPIKYVVSFTSQDEKHPVHNLISQDVFKKWLCNPQDRTGLMEATFQLEYPCVISYINIGSVWCATVEVRVGRSDWPAGREFEILIHTVSLMTPADCTLSKNPVKTEMFTADSFSPEVAKQKWDRIKVLCRQPYRKLTQFGLSFLHIQTSEQVQSFVTTTPERAVDQPTDRASVKSIKQYFLCKIGDGGNKSNNELKSKLLKIAASSESGAEQPGALSRTAKLVLAASGSVKKQASHGAQTPDSVKMGLYSSHLDKKYGPEFEEETKEFLSKLTLNPAELDNITLADVRHKFEKKKRRKLTKEEKKKFAELTTETLASVFDDDYAKETNNRPENKKLRSESSLNNTPNNDMITGDKEGNLVPNVNSVGTLQKDIRTQLKLRNNNKDNCHATVDNKRIDDDSDIRKSKPNMKTSIKIQESEQRNTTPGGKRKLSLSSDTVSAPSKRKLLVKGDNTDRKITSKRITNDNVLDEKPKNKENSFTGLLSDKKGRTLNTDKKQINLKQGDRVPKQRMKPEDEVRDSPDVITKTNTPFKNSSFGKFLLNVTISSSDDDDDDDILFPKQKVARSVKRKCKGKKKKSSLNDTATSVDSPSSPLGVENAFKEKKGRGRGSSRQKKTKAWSNANSMEVRPTGFARCEGCSDYFDAVLLSVHHTKCKQWSGKQEGKNKTIDTPWLCARPGNSSASSTKNKLAEFSAKSSPGLRAAMAAEERLKRQSDKDYSGDTYNINVGKSFGKDSNYDSSKGENASCVVQEQRKALEQLSKLKRNTWSAWNSKSDTESRTKSNVKIQTRNSNQSEGYFFADNKSSSRYSGCFDLTMGDNDSDSTDSLTDVSPMVECPLCGDLLPSNVVEQHAANCML